MGNFIIYCKNACTKNYESISSSEEYLDDLPETVGRTAVYWNYEEDYFNPNIQPCQD